MVKQTTVYNVSLHLHAKFQKCHLKFDAVSAFSLVKGYNTFSFLFLCYERLLSTRISNVARLSLGRAPFGGGRFRPNLGRMKVGIFSFAVFFAPVECIRVG